jgi:hypothetical protein
LSFGRHRCRDQAKASLALILREMPFETDDDRSLHVSAARADMSTGRLPCRHVAFVDIRFLNSLNRTNADLAFDMQRFTSEVLPRFKNSEMRFFAIVVAEKRALITVTS